MIKILFPPGCYGTFVARSLYNWTCLRQGQYIPMVFDPSGSSHSHRQNQHARSHIMFGHTSTLVIEPGDQVIVVKPDQAHALDYYNNQYYKQDHQQLIQFVGSQLCLQEITTKLSTQWNYSGKFDQSTPLWILREFFSFCIIDILQQAYSTSAYENTSHIFSLSTQDIFDNYLNTFEHMCDVLQLSIDVSRQQQSRDHENFTKAQSFYNRQIECDQWIEACVQDQQCRSPCTSILDEAYVQAMFRHRGYEIRCDQLNQFPDNSQQMKDLIYAIENL